MSRKVESAGRPVPPPVPSTRAINPQGCAAGRVELDAGRHQIQVDYFESGGGAILEVSYDGPGTAK